MSNILLLKNKCITLIEIFIERFTTEKILRFKIGNYIFDKII